VRKLIFTLGCPVALVAAAIGSAQPAAANGPSCAVLDFSTEGLTSNWWGQWQPGVAVSDLLTDNIVNSGKFDVLDRKNIDQTLQEHQLGASGEVDPATAINAGHLVGAHFLIEGNIVQFEQTGTSGAAAGGFIPGPVGAVIGGVRQDRVTLKVAMRVVDALTGRIVQSAQEEMTERATSIGGGAFVGLAGGGYSNSSFTSSAMGHLVNDVAIKLASDLDPSKFTSGPPPVNVSGHVLEVDGGNIILNVGSSRGVTVGQYFNVEHVKHIKDPDSGRILTVPENTGQIEVMQVSGDSSVARRVSGSVTAGEAIQSQ